MHVSVGMGLTFLILQCTQELFKALVLLIYLTFQSLLSQESWSIYSCPHCFPLTQDAAANTPAFKYFH